MSRDRDLTCGNLGEDFWPHRFMRPMLGWRHIFINRRAPVSSTKSAARSFGLWGFSGPWVLLGLLVGSAPAGAADRPEHPMPQACQADASKLCPGMTPGDGKLGACLREHHEQFSQECKEAIRAMREAHRAQHPASGGN